MRQEHELLKQHKQDNFFSLLSQVHGDLATRVMLLQHLDDSADFSGSDLFMIGEVLSRPLEVLSVACSQLANIKLVQKSAVPA